MPKPPPDATPPGVLPSGPAVTVIALEPHLVRDIIVPAGERIRFNNAYRRDISFRLEAPGAAPIHIGVGASYDFIFPAAGTYGFIIGNPDPDVAAPFYRGVISVVARAA